MISIRALVRYLLTTLLMWSVPSFAATLSLEKPDVQAFINEIVTRDHLDRQWVTDVLLHADFKQSIVDTMSKPAEHVRAWHDYRAIFITERRIREGREFFVEHRAQLEETSRKTGVPPEIICAIVGVETSYGKITGTYRVLDALATLAFDYPPRASYFRSELEQFLLLSKEAKFDPLKVTGSYGGAMGAPQFMPRSYREFAADGDKDGRIDLWNSWPDIIQSVARYFVIHGWKSGEPVVAKADLWYPDVADLPAGRIELTESVAGLRSKGVLFDAPVRDETRAVFLALRDADGPTYRVGFHNFWVITRYNNSNMYALAVSELADAIASGTSPTSSVTTQTTHP